MSQKISLGRICVQPAPGITIPDFQRFGYALIGRFGWTSELELASVNPEGDIRRLFVMGLITNGHVLSNPPPKQRKIA